MAYHLCSSPSSLFHEPPSICSPSRKFKVRNFASSSLTPQSKTFLHANHVSLQEPIPQQLTQEEDANNSEDPVEKSSSASSSKSNYIWVNPRSSRAKQLRKKSYDARYTSLANLAHSLDSCNPTEQDVSQVLKDLGDNILEQDAVIVINNMENSVNVLLVLKYFQQKIKPNREVILYNVTLKVFRKCKDLDGAEKVFGEMLERGVEPDNVTFSTIISCARMCYLPNKAVEWFEKMPSFGCEPDDVTYSAMIDAYGRAEKWRIDPVTFSTLIKMYGMAGNYDGCLNVYEEMKALGVKPNLVIYNTLLDAMGRAKRPWQAKTIHKEMTNNGFSPSWATYASLLRAYGRARYSEDALIIYKEMKEKGMGMNTQLYNTLLAMCADCYGKAKRTDDVVKTFNQLLDLGISPDDRFCGCLLNVMTQTPKEELGKLTDCVEKANPKLGSVVRYLVEGLEGDGEFRKESSELFNSIVDEVKKAFCNSLIDLCVNLNSLDKAGELLDLGLTLKIYTNIHSRSQTQWSLHLKSLSLGAALTALHVWINDLSKALESGEDLPPVLGINTGHGKHKYTEKGLASVFESHLKELNSPFHEAPDKAGWFLTTQEAVKSWLESKGSSEVAAA
ncbi:Tetratricopeptide-like helical domain superfamily [Sesbania bispinosa]|nr:Tetratricopeptide-like helical domain superfamily [Sesbania bispinosa]